MIKTHKPRGHYWTHASVFQQTKEFRNICYDECDAPTSRNVLLEPEERLPESARAAKRRRIEKLADDFLNGQPLFISSARPCPSSLKSTIIWNKKSSNEPKFAIPTVNILHDSSSLWEDVEDAEEFLRRCMSRSESPPLEAEEGTIHCQPDAGDSEHAEIHAKAKSRPSRRCRSTSITAGPSEEALKQAAALRARKAQLADTGPVAGPDQHSDGGRGLRSSEKRVEPRETDLWLSRRQSHKAPAISNIDEDSLDELRLSNIESPSNATKAPRPSDLSQPVAHLDISRKSRRSHISETDRDTIVVKPVVGESSAARGKHQRNRSIPVDGKASIECAEQNSFHTAHEETEIREEEPSSNKDMSQDDSQTRLLRSQGFPSTSRTSWQAVNKTRPPSEELSSTGVDASSAIDTPTDRRMTRAGAAVSKQTSDPPTFTDHARPVYGIRKQVRYTNQQSSANGSSPFKWRRKVTFPSSDEIEVTSKEQRLNKTMSQNAPVTPAASKPYASSATQTSSHGPKPPHSAPASNLDEITQGQQSLPETWIGTQAMLFQAQRDLLTSPEKPLPADQPDPTTVLHDLDKSTGGAYQTSDRAPSKQLSQEPMPSTQALIGDFAGFSTVKKPWNSRPRASLDSPTVLLKGGRAVPTPPDVSRTDDWIEIYELPQKPEVRRSSNLRFSLESTDSPLHSTNIERHPSSTTSLPQRPADWSSMDIATSSSNLKPRKSSGSAAKTSPLAAEDPIIQSGEVHDERESQSFSFSTAAPLPSFQAAQAFSSLRPDDSFEESDLDKTIEELTTQVLNVTDLDGVLSQVG